MIYWHVVNILKKWKWTVLAVSLIAFALVAAAPKKKMTIQPNYTSSSKILITPPSRTVRGLAGQSASAAADFSWFADPAVLTELLRSEELLARVIQSSNTQMPWAELSHSISVSPLSEQRYGRNIRLFSLSVVNPDPKEAQKLTRLLTDEFVKYVEDLSAREFASTRRFIEELVAEAEERRNVSDSALSAVREKYLSLPSDEAMAMQARSLEGRTNELERKISSVRVEVASLKDYLDGRVSSPPWSVMSNTDGSLGALEANRAKKQLELAEIRETYTDESRHVVAAKSQLAKADQLYKKALNDNITSLHNAKSSELQQAVAQRSSLVGELNALMRSKMTQSDRRLVTKLERELQVWEQNHLSLQQQLYQARVVEQSSRRQGAVNVLEQPGIGKVAYDPNAKVTQTTNAMKRNLLALPFCLVLGCAAGLLREYLTSSTKLRPRIEEALEVPVIAVIPATPSELTIDWESFKRPDEARLAAMIEKNKHGKFSQRSRSGRFTEIAEPSTAASFGDHTRFRNNK